MSQLGAGPASATPWAFAFWGARFYVFYKGESDSTTNVWRLAPGRRKRRRGRA